MSGGAPGRARRLAALGAAAAVAWRVARELVDEARGPMSMLNAFGAWIEAFGLACAAVVAAGGRRERRATAGVLAAAAALRALQAAHVRPGRPDIADVRGLVRALGATALDFTRPPDGRTRPRTRSRHGVAPAPAAGTTAAGLRVWTSNLLYTNADASGLVAGLERARPDLVCLQELTPGVAAALEEALGHAFPHRILAPATHPYGFGLLSRYPLREGRLDDLGAGNDSLQTATLDVDGRDVDVYNAHLVSPADFSLLRTRSPGAVTRLRHAQAEEIAARVRAGRRPAIVVGDLNAGPDQVPARSLAAVAADAWAVAGAGWGATWPRRLIGTRVGLPALLRLDYVFVTHELEPIRARTLQAAGGSDHCPVVVDARWATG